MAGFCSQLRKSLRSAKILAAMNTGSGSTSLIRVLVLKERRRQEWGWLGERVGVGLAFQEVGVLIADSLIFEGEINELCNSK